MHRFSTTLDLNELIGSEIQQICCGRYHVQFHFHSGTSISAQGDLTLWLEGKEIGTWNDNENWSTLLFQRMLNLRVTGYSVPNEQLLQIEFDNGLSLRLHDSSDSYESFQITKASGELIVI